MSSPHQPTIPTTLPPDVVAYRRSPTFSEQTLPAGLRKDHATKTGVWALIHVLEGQLRYHVPSWGHDTILEPGQTGIVAPEVLHAVEPQGSMQMYVEFYALPEAEPGEPHSTAVLA